MLQKQNLPRPLEARRARCWLPAWRPRETEEEGHQRRRPTRSCGLWCFSLISSKTWILLSSFGMSALPPDTWQPKTVTLETTWVNISNIIIGVLAPMGCWMLRVSYLTCTGHYHLKLSLLCQPIHNSSFCIFFQMVMGCYAFEGWGRLWWSCTGTMPRRPAPTLQNLPEEVIIIPRSFIEL